MITQHWPNCMGASTYTESQPQIHYDGYDRIVVDLPTMQIYMPTNGRIEIEAL